MKKWDWQLYLYTGNLINPDAFYEYFPPNGSDEEWRIHYVEDELAVLYELHIHLKDGRVQSVDTFKADVYGGHGRPIIDEKNLASDEKKHALEIFDLCLINPFLAEVDDVINLAVKRKATYQGFTINSSGKTSVFYTTPSGEKGTIAKKRIVDALKCAHLDLRIIRDVEFIQEFSRAFSKAAYEPLYAILLCVDPTAYENYTLLDSEYCFEKLEQAVCEANLQKCEEYKSGIKKDAASILKSAVYSGNTDIVKWVLDLIEPNADMVNYAISYAINLNHVDIFELLLSVVTNYEIESKSAQDAVNAAARQKNIPIIEKLLKKGYPFISYYAHEVYAVLSLDEIKEWLKYKVFLTPDVLSRIVAEGRKDILKIIEENPDKYVTEGMLLQVYIEGKEFEKFKKMVHSCDSLQDVNLFISAFENGSEWADVLIAQGFDVNQDEGRLLHKACENLDSCLVIYLIENGADITLKGEYSCSAFERAAGFHGNCMSDTKIADKEVICKCFLELGVDLMEQTNKSSLCVLAYLFSDDSTLEFKKYIIDWLVHHNKINSSTADGKYVPLDFLISFQKKDEKAIMYMLEKGANPNALKSRKNTLFVEASMHGYSYAVLEKMLLCGAEIDERDQLDRTAIYHAAEVGDVECVKWLVEHGCNFNCVCDVYKFSHNGRAPQTPLDIAIENNKVECVKYLRSLGAKQANACIKGE